MVLRYWAVRDRESSSLHDQLGPTLTAKFGESWPLVPSIPPGGLTCFTCRVLSGGPRSPFSAALSESRTLMDQLGINGPSLAGPTKFCLLVHLPLSFL